MNDLPGVVFVAAASFLLGLVLVDIFWDIRAVGPEPYTRETADAIVAFYTNNVVGTRRRAPYLIALMPLAFLIVVAALGYKCYRGLSTGDHHAVITSSVSMGVLFPLIALAAISTFPTIAALVTDGARLPLETLHTMQRRLLVQHVIYWMLTAAAILLHIVL